MTNIGNQVSLCKWPLGAMPIRFGTAPDELIIDEETSANLRIYETYATEALPTVRQLLSIDRTVSWLPSFDLSPDGSTWEYAVQGTNFQGPNRDRADVSIHLASAKGDEEIVRFTAVSRARVEFSPDGRYLAAGVSDATGSQATSSLVVRTTLDNNEVFAARGSSQFAWAGNSDHLYFDDGSKTMQWIEGGASLAFAGRMVDPAVSPDKHYVAFNNGVDQPNRLQILDTATGSVASVPGFGSRPHFLTDSMLFFESQVVCNPGCPPYGAVMPGHKVTYNLVSRSLTNSNIWAIFDTWPRGNMPYGVV